MKFIIRKIIEAKTASQALKIEKNFEPVDCYMHPQIFDSLATQKNLDVKGFQK